MDHDMDQIRAIARSIAEQGRQDEDFRQQIRLDPVSTLTKAGLPEEFVQTFLREVQSGEVTAYSFERKCQLSLVEFIQDFIY